MCRLNQKLSGLFFDSRCAYEDLAANDDGGSISRTTL